MCLEYWNNGRVECWVGKFESNIGVFYSLNPLFHHSSIPSFQFGGMSNGDRNAVSARLTGYYISVMIIAFDLHTAVHVKHPRQFRGLTGIALCGISNTSTGHIFKHSSQESHLSGST
jgi:hypothetical protein